ncbi:MAG: DUF922 domain-containing protein [Ferruginibacter sp.]|nr:DUF922 domain-containing protein [Ferruginibacter sp.]
MKKYFCIILLISAANLLNAQDIIINGRKGNRLLTWNDFKGEPDMNSSHDALTFWNIDYGLKNIRQKGDTMKIGEFTVTLSLEGDQCWIKPQKKSERLLKHEQGHFDIGLICQHEIINTLNNTVFFKADFQQKINSIFSSLLNKYQSLGRQYDKETNHSINQQSQDTWNAFFDKELNR